MGAGAPGCAGREPFVLRVSWSPIQSCENWGGPQPGSALGAAWVSIPGALAGVGALNKGPWPLGWQGGGEMLMGPILKRKY